MGVNFRWTTTWLTFLGHTKDSLRGAAITDVQRLLGHASVKTTEKAYAAFVKNERFKQTIDLLDKPTMPKLRVVK